jgi:hypothetical protein
MSDHLDRLLTDYQRLLAGTGWAVRLDRSLDMPRHDDEQCQLVFEHVLSGEVGYIFPVSWDNQRIRDWIDPDIEHELRIVSEAPPSMRNPGKVAMIRGTLSGWDWDLDTRRRVCTLLLQLKVVTTKEATWLIKAGVRRSGDPRERSADP